MVTANDLKGIMAAFTTKDGIGSMQRIPLIQMSSLVKIFSKVVTPECFYRGSGHGSTLLTMTLIDRRVRVSPGFHFDMLSVASPVEPPLKSMRGIDPKKIKKRTIQ
jgi:hypothetical protein